MYEGNRRDLFFYLKKKKRRRGNSESSGKVLQSVLKELFPNSIGRIFQEQRQSKEVI